MILTKEIEIKINAGNIPYYKNIDIFKNIKKGDIILVPLRYIPKTHRYKIKVKCDVCDNEREILFSTYWDSTKKETQIYCCKGKCSNIKREQTNLRLYGVKNCFQNEEMKQKQKKTMIEKYGVEHNMQTQKCLDDRVETYRKNYGCDNPSQSEKIKKKKTKTCRENFGVDYPFQSEEVMNKSYETNLKKYGTKLCTQNLDIKEKTKQTNVKRYGKDYYLQTKDKQEKSIKTCLEKYGVENPVQNIDIYNKIIKSSTKVKYFKNTELHYQGKYELDFLEKYSNIYIIKNGMTIRYKNNRIYYPDFYLPHYNLIVEIKSSYWYNKYLNSNLEKQKSCIEQGYNFIFIINKNYDEFSQLVENQKSA